MTPIMLVYIAAAILQAGLLGRNMYAMICITDLESDYINPFDFTTRMNTWVMPELVASGLITALLLLSGCWFTALAHVGLLAYLGHLFTKRRMYVDSMDAFRQLPGQKQQRTVLLVGHLALFVIIIYRLVETAIHTLLTPEGRALTKQLLHEAAASIHGY